MIFQYTERETAYLAQRDPRLGWAIGQIGPIEREVDPGLFSSVVHHIIGQQISTAAQKTIWNRLRGKALASATGRRTTFWISPGRYSAAC